VDEVVEKLQAKGFFAKRPTVVSALVHAQLNTPFHGGVDSIRSAIRTGKGSPKSLYFVRK
jgi:hypothetical protein